MTARLRITEGMVKIMHRLGFDNEKYLNMQSEQIRKRISDFGGKLYLEFGGKLFDDYHAARVLPGFQPDSKVNMLLTMRDEAEVVVAINAGDIERNTRRGDLGITYDLEVLRLIDAFRGCGLFVGSVVLTQYSSQPAAKTFQERLESLGIKVYRHYFIAGYPNDVSHIVSDEGFGKNDYIETSRSLVVVTAPGPGSGKMAVCLSQLYHEHQRGVKAGYAKFETFPVWNLPLNHPVNIAYEAATTNLDDVNMIDPFHLDAYGITTINYNRDVEVFPVLQAIFERINGDSPYKSPTDMGVNMVGNCIFDGDVVSDASNKEIIRRFYEASCALIKGNTSKQSVFKNELLIKKAGLDVSNRKVVAAALAKEEETDEPAAAMELPDGRVITGRTSPLLGASSALLLNALKALGDIPDDVHLISPSVIEPIQELKTRYLGGINPRLHTDEVLIALTISANMDETAKKAVDQLKNLKGCEVHTTVILSQADDNTFRKLGTNLTSESKYQTKRLYHKS